MLNKRGLRYIVLPLKTQCSLLVLSKQFFSPPYWLSVGAGEFQYSGVFSLTACFSFFLFLNPGNTQSLFTDERCEGFCVEQRQKRNRKSEEQRVVTAEMRCVCEGSSELPPSSLAIAAPLFAFCPSPAPARSSGSHSGAAGDARAPALSTGPRPDRHRCTGRSLSA